MCCLASFRRIVFLPEGAPTVCPFGRALQMGKNVGVGARKDNTARAPGVFGHKRAESPAVSRIVWQELRTHPAPAKAS